jgi:formylglycine-generating enzyme required for sulfatase activity
MMKLLTFRRFAACLLSAIAFLPTVHADTPTTQATPQYTTPATTRPGVVVRSCPACGTGLSLGHFLHAPAAAPPAATQPVVATGNKNDAQSEHAGMVRIPGGTFWMGSDDPRFPDASPVHQVQLDGFWIDRTDVTNAEFEKFVNATGYVTVAEKKPDPASMPGVPPQLLVAGAVVFTKPANAVTLDDPSQWWRYVPGANWRHPQGPSSDLRGKENHPVVDIAWEDAVAYANWAHKRLPTEAEWEYAARGGLDRKRYAWGDEFNPAGKFMANTFQGHFPDNNTAEDGFRETSPVGSFPPNGYGLYDMAGNVWQWCSDWYRPDYYATLTAADSKAVASNPKGPDNGYDPDEPQVAKRIMKGGSYLCTDQYCGRFMPGSRGKGDPDTPLNHVGFRCVQSIDPTPDVTRGLATDPSSPPAGRTNTAIDPHRQ